MANTALQRIFTDMMADIKKYQREATDADKVYTGKMEKAREESKAYKDEAAALQKRREDAKFHHNGALFAADTSFVNSMSSNVSYMRDYLKTYLCSAPDPAFMSVLSYYKQFGLEMSRTELDSLLNMANGSYIGLKALASVAKECGGWKVSTPDATEFEKDIAAIEQRMTHRPVLWHDHEYHKAACETRDTSSAMSREEAVRALKAYGIANADSTIDWKATSLELLGAKGTFDALVGRISEMYDRWSTGFVPEVSAYTDELKQMGITGDMAEQAGEVMRKVDAAAAAASAKVDSDAAEKIARQIAERHSKAAKESKAILEAYDKK